MRQKIERTCALAFVNYRRLMETANGNDFQLREASGMIYLKQNGVETVFSSCGRDMFKQIQVGSSVRIQCSVDQIIRFVKALLDG